MRPRGLFSRPRIGKAPHSFILLCVCALLLSGCARQIGLAALNAPSYFNDLTINRDIVFDSKTGQSLDIYRPGEPSQALRPVVVFFYGGKWTYSEKSDFHFIGTRYAHADYITVIPDYRKYPSVKSPAFFYDAAAALSWVYDHIAEYGGDPKRIHVLGHSAGAQIGALVTADPKYLKFYGKDRNQVIQSFAGLAGPYDFIPNEPDLIDMFGPPYRYPNISVSNFINGKQPPMLLLYGDRDEDVEAYNIEILERAIKTKGGCVKTIIYPNLGHLGIMASLSWLKGPPVLEDTTAFFQSVDARRGCGQ